MTTSYYNMKGTFPRIFDEYIIDKHLMLSWKLVIIKKQNFVSWEASSCEFLTMILAQCPCLMLLQTNNELGLDIL